MASFNCELFLDGHSYRVTRCSYGFSQATAHRGRAAAKVRSGVIALGLSVPDGDALVDWAASPSKKLNGQLVFRDIGSPMVRELVEFEDAYCVGYDETFAAGNKDDGAYECVLHISAGKISVGAEVKDNHWELSR